jgi:hypothetical protein
MAFNARTKLNIVLLIGVAVLGLLAYLKPGHQGPAAGPPLIALKPADVTDIQIASGKAPPIVLQRVADGWRMTAPLQLGADAGEVRTLLEDLDTTSEREFPAAAAELGKYGLAPPNLRLSFNGIELELGDPAPLDNRLYARLGGGKAVNLISARLYYHAQHDAYGWVDKHLLPAGARIVGLQLPQATLNQDHNGRWQLAPRDERVSADAIQHLLDEWQQATALGIAAIGKQRPEGEVAIELQGATAPLRFQILKDDSLLVLARPDLGLEYQLDQSERARLLEFALAPAAGTAHPAAAHR